MGFFIFLVSATTNSIMSHAYVAWSSHPCIVLAQRSYGHVVVFVCPWPVAWNNACNSVGWCMSCCRRHCVRGMELKLAYLCWHSLMPLVSCKSQLSPSDGHGHVPMRVGMMRCLSCHWAHHGWGCVRVHAPRQWRCCRTHSTLPTTALKCVLTTTSSVDRL
jgi:hypothetical protein